MGVNRSDWIVIGANIGYGKYDDEEYEKFDEFSAQDKVGEITYLIDGMSGEYFVVGIVIRADDDGYNGLGIFEINLVETYEEYRKLAKEHIKESFGIETEPSLIIMTHWT